MYNLQLKIRKSNNQSGQIVVILLLVIVVALAVGLSVVGRSTTEISTATKLEDSSRAFSAAEAGIDRAISKNLNNLSPTPVVDLFNNSQATVAVKTLPLASVRNLEQFGLKKSSFAQFWLADPDHLDDKTDPNHYPRTNTIFRLYFGAYPNSGVQPAIEVHIIYRDSAGAYKDKRYFYDPDISRRGVNQFSPCLVSPSGNIDTNEGGSPKRFLCGVNVSLNGLDFPIMVRARILYSDNHSVVISPVIGNFPPQVKIYESKGTAGNTQRVVKVSRQPNVMPFLFDFVLYSDQPLSK